MRWLLSIAVCLHLLVPSEFLYPQEFSVRKPEVDAPLLVICAASPQERSSAEELIGLANDRVRLEAQAKAWGYKIIANGEVLYLLPPRSWRCDTYVRVSELAEQLSLVSPRSTRPLSQCSPAVRALIWQWLHSERNPSKPRDRDLAERLFARGHIWWSAMMSFEVEVGGQTYRGTAFFDLTPSVPVPELESSQPSAPPLTPFSESPRPKESEEREEMLLFSRKISQQQRAEHARAYYECVLREYQTRREEYQRLVSQLQSSLLNHFGLPHALVDTESEACFFSTLPNWTQEQIAKELRGCFPDRSESEVKSILAGGKVRASLLPVVLVGGFVDELAFESYGWGLSDLLSEP